MRTAIEDTLLLVVERRHFLPFLRQNEDLFLRLLAVLCRRLRRTSMALEEIALFDLPVRLARVLLKLAEDYGRPDPAGTRIDLKLSQRDLSNLVAVVARERQQAVARVARDGRGRSGGRLHRAAPAGRAAGAHRRQVNPAPPEPRELKPRALTRRGANRCSAAMRMAACIVAALVLLLARPAAAQGPAQSRYFVTSDGVRLHYLEAGPRIGHTIVFVPGWTMPAWIWQPQIRPSRSAITSWRSTRAARATRTRPPSGYEPGRRGQDIAELIANLTPVPVLLVGWSLGVLDTLAYVRAHGDEKVAGLVLVDNSVGEEPPPPPRAAAPPRAGAAARHRHAPLRPRHVPPPAERELSGPAHRGDAAHARTGEPRTAGLSRCRAPTGATRCIPPRRPVLYVVRPGWLSEQAANLARNRPGTQIAVFGDAGHALFVDDAARFNALLAGFIARTVWP